jgi:hypothetical protein
MFYSFGQFFESASKRLIIVDVQPSYAKVIPWIKEFPQFVDQYSEILTLYNGPDLGMENKSEIAKFYWRNGMKKETIYRMKWFQKNYAFFRDLMDQCWLREYIVKIARYMLRNKINDIRQLSKEDVKKINVPDLLYNELEKYGFYIPDLANYIRKWNGADICGGGFHECLDEVMILADAMRLKFNIIHKFTYV